MISIIIPVYNGEKYIANCIKSLVNVRTDIEIIIINDGSTDNTENILKPYQKFERITVISQENKGVSEARNKGLEVAKGEYIMFCDIDDHYDENVIPYIKKKLQEKNIDLLIFGRKDIQGDKLICKYQIENIKDKISSLEYLEKYFCNGKHTYSVVNKVYKSSIIKENNLRFNKDFKYSEDTLFNLEYILHCKNFSVEENCYYIRYYNVGSAIYKKHKNFYFENINVIKYFENILKDDKKLYKNVINELYNHYAIVAINRICDGIDSEGKKQDIKSIKKILEDISSRKINIEKETSFRKKLFIWLIKHRQSTLIYFIFSYLRRIYHIRKEKNSINENK